MAYERCPHNCLHIERYGPLCVQCYREGLVQPSDAARRVSDMTLLHVAATGWDERVHGWCAFKLIDGTSDGVLYPSRREAVLHQKSLDWFCYFTFQNSPNGMKPYEAALWLGMERYQRDQWGSGMEDAGVRRIEPVTLEDMQRELNEFAARAAIKGIR